MISRHLFLLLLVCTACEESLANELPPFVIAWPESIENILLADASTSTLYRYYRTDSGLEREAIYMSVGKRGVGKQRERDRKTPLGVYFVTEQLDTTHLDPMYGITAFPLDYPNARDAMLGRDGSGIWIHGVLPDSGQRPALDTDGCLAIGNEDLARLAPMINPGVTPVLVSRALAAAVPQEILSALEAELRAKLGIWHKARQQGYAMRLEDIYSNDFEHQGMGRDDWLVLWSRERAESVMRDLFISMDTEDAGLYVTRFRLEGENGTRDMRLYWERQPDKSLQIVAEDVW